MRIDRGTVLLVAQTACLAGLAWPGRRRWRSPVPVRLGAGVAGLVGGALAAAGAAGLGPALQAHPRVPTGAPLRTDGVYAAVRHPIYAGLLLAGVGLAVLRQRPEPLAAWVGLAGVLHVKVAYEEEQLAAAFGPAYAAYAAAVPRLVPRLVPRVPGR